MAASPPQLVSERSLRGHLRVVASDSGLTSEGAPAADLVSELVDALGPRLPEVAPAQLVGLVREALDDLGEPRVTTFLPILVERRILDLRREDHTAAEHRG